MLFAAVPMVASLGGGMATRPQIALSAPDPNAIFGSLRSTLMREAFPSLVSYEILVHVESKGAVHEDHYDGELDGESGEFRVRQFSHEESATSYVPHGINVVIEPLPGAVPLVLSRQLPAEPLGVPNLSPIYSFGLRTCPAASSAPDHTLDQTGLRQIGFVLSTSRTYNVVFVGDELIDGMEASHLTLVPIHKPQDNRVRDVWVDDLGELVQARVAGNFVQRETQAVSWLIKFQTIGGLIFIKSESAEGPVSVGRQTYDVVSIQFSHIRSSEAPRSLQFALPYSSGGGLHEPAGHDPC